MDPIIIITIISTVISSYFGFTNISYFEKYKFNVSKILNYNEYRRLISSGFLHADWMHLFFNMFTLYFFGPIVIQFFGKIGFIAIYIGAILLGNLFSLYLYKNQGWYTAIGASGGVSGILFSAIAVYPSLGIMFFPIPIAIPGFIYGALYFGYSVYMMLNPQQQDNIGHPAHLGGAFFGMLYAFIIFPKNSLENALYIGIMSLPLLYLAYQVFIRKKIG